LFLYNLLKAVQQILIELLEQRLLRGSEWMWFISQQTLLKKQSRIK